MATAQVIAVDEAGAEQAGIVLGPRRPVAADRRVLLEIDNDAEAISTLKVAGPIAIFFLFAYGVAEVLRVGQHGLTQYHYAAFAVISLFFGLTWLSVFRRYWKAWTLATCGTMISLFVKIASLGGLPELAF